MKNSNVKTSMARKGKIVAGTVMTLAAAAIMTMAPMSQAFAATASVHRTDNGEKRLIVAALNRPHTVTGYGPTSYRASEIAYAKALAICDGAGLGMNPFSPRYGGETRVGARYVKKLTFQCVENIDNAGSER